MSCTIVHGHREPLGAIRIIPFFHAHQDFAYPVPRFVVVAARRHVCHLDTLTEEEAVDYMTLLRAIRRAQRRVLGIEHVYYFVRAPHG